MDPRRYQRSNRYFFSQFTQILAGTASVILGIAALGIVASNTSQTDPALGLTYVCAGVWCGVFVSRSCLVMPDQGGSSVNLVPKSTNLFLFLRLFCDKLQHRKWLKSCEYEFSAANKIFIILAVLRRSVWQVCLTLLLVVTLWQHSSF